MSLEKIEQRDARAQSQPSTDAGTHIPRSHDGLTPLELEAGCRAMHEEQGSAGADDPMHAPYQKSWEEPELVRWQQWIETVEAVHRAIAKARKSAPQLLGQTDFLTDPDTLDAFMEANPLPTATEDLIARLEAAEATAAEYRQTFDLQWKADQRAIKLWQAAHPGNDMVWPDRCNMVVWLLEKLGPAECRIAELEAALKKFTLFRNPDEEIAHYAGLCIKAAEESGRELLHEDLCRLSVVFGHGSDLRDDRDRRINERLKAMLAMGVQS